MANDGKIYITISDTRNGSGAGLTADVDSKKEKESAVEKFIEHRFFNFVEGQAKQFVNYAVSNIGNFTGNYQAQREVQSAMTAVNFLINLGTAAVVGSKFGVPGIAVSVGLTVASQGIGIVEKELSEQMMNKKVNRNLEMMRNRLGLEGLTNGSRTGGY